MTPSIACLTGPGIQCVVPPTGIEGPLQAAPMLVLSVWGGELALKLP